MVPNLSIPEFEKLHLEQLTKDYPVLTNEEILQKYPITKNQLNYLSGKYKLKKARATRARSAGKQTFTDEQNEFIRANFYKMTNREMSVAMGITRTVLRTHCYNMGLKRMQMEYWSDEQVQFLVENYQRIGDVEIAEIFNEVYPKNKTWTNKHIEKKRGYLGLKRTERQIAEIKARNVRSGRFAVNHWKRWIGRVTKPGTIRKWNNNGREYLVIKTENGFVHYPRWLYKKHHGTIPDGMIVRVKNDLLDENITIDDLELISREENGHRNATKYVTGLCDAYVAGIITNGNKEIRKDLIQNKELLHLKRQQLQLNRLINNGTEGKTN